jgi:DNA polymerase III delta prime subunit
MNTTLIPNPSSIRNSLRQAAASQMNYVNNYEDPEMKKRASDLLTAALALQAQLNRNPTKGPIKVKANGGIGRPARVPYLRIFDLNFSPNASTGFYVCAFLAADGESIVISLQQPATGGSANDFRPLERSVLEIKSVRLLEELLETAATKDIAIEIGATRSQASSVEPDDQSLMLRGFSESDVISKTLSVIDLPSDTELVRLIHLLFDLSLYLNVNHESTSSKEEMSLSTIASKIYWSEQRLRDVLSSLSDSSPQVVLAGPPGTGKTYVSRWIASELLGSPGHIHDPRITTVQFHPTYGYEDFVEGLRPVAKDGSVVFETVPGSIVNLANQILDDGEPRVLIIDEINRANIARVFGELMYLLEYRDQKIDLMLRKDFVLPKELFIIATMNTADKSTRVMDAALRRRFDFFAVEPDVDVLRGFYASGHGHNLMGEELYLGFVKLNQRLEEDLDQHRLIGHSYFMSEYFDVASLQARWERQISPLLDEYFYERQTQTGKYKLEDFWPSANS